MATYQKALKSIEIYILGAADNTVQATDVPGSPIASNALAEFEAGQTIHISAPNGEAILIPFHAVVMVAVTVNTEEVTRADAYGCGNIGEDFIDPEPPVDVH